MPYPSPRPPLLCGGSTSFVVGLDGSLEGLWVRAYNLTYLFTILEEEEGRHGADAEFLGDVWNLVDIELVEAGVRVCVGEPGEAIIKMCFAVIRVGSLLDDLRRNDLARSAPGGEAVEDEEGILGFQRLVPIGLATSKSQPSVAEANDVVARVRQRAPEMTQTQTHVFKLCTPSLPSLFWLIVLEKNLWVGIGR
jgi:hypothetical protein